MTDTRIEEVSPMGATLTCDWCPEPATDSTVVDGVIAVFEFASCETHFDCLVRVVRYASAMNGYEGDGDDADWDED